jgi:hypothetical protein
MVSHDARGGESLSALADVLQNYATFLSQELNQFL